MSFTASQVRKLRSKIKPQHVKTRDADGVSLSYVEGWHVEAEANRIFGFDGWDRETVSCDCVWTKQVNGRYCAAYVTRIRIRVRAGEAVIVREGSGAGESNAPTPGQAYEFAAKAAETDATKRALMTFGNSFGLSLYGGTAVPREKVSSPNEVQHRRGQTTVVMPAAAAPDVTHPLGLPAGHVIVQASNGQEEHASPTSAGERLERTEIMAVASSPAREGAVDRSEISAWPEIRPFEEAERLNRERIDKGVLAISEPRRIRHLGHLAFVASKPCLVCGRNRAHAHHLKFAQPTALGRKVSDEFTVPLCSLHHRELHQNGDERAWWATRGVDALKVAEELWLSRRRPMAAENRA